MDKHQIKRQKRYYGFTLVELIIVITILSILATISFVSFSGYTQKSNDSKRLSNLKNITNQINIYYAQNSNIPELKDYKTGTFNGNEISYVGDVDKDFLDKLKISGFKDDFNMYNYGYSFDKKYFQVATYIKTDVSFGNNLIPQTYANLGEYKSKIDGNYLGILKFINKNKNNNKYIVNIPSLIFYGSGKELKLEDNSTYFSLNNINNSPLNNTNIKTQDLIKQKLGDGATLTGVNIENLEVNSLGSTFTGGILKSFGGNLNLIQTNIFDTSKVGSKYCYVGEKILKSGESIKRYSKNEIDKFSSDTCEGISKTFTCNDGVISQEVNNTYKFESCVKGEINNCVANSNYEKEATVFNIGIKTHGEDFSVDSGDISIDNGVFYYTLNGRCNDGSYINEVKSSRKNKSCNSGYLYDGVNSCLKVGSNQATPGNSCLDILEKGGSVGDGTYWIKPDSNPSFQVYCDMTTDGGGWTMVAVSKPGDYNNMFNYNKVGGNINLTTSVTSKLSTPIINSIILSGESKLRLQKEGSLKFIYTYSNLSGNPLSFTQFKSYNLSLTDNLGRTSQFYDSHPHFIIGAAITHDKFVSSLCTSGCRQTFSVFNTTTQKLGVTGDLAWYPTLKRAGYGSSTLNTNNSTYSDGFIYVK